MNYPYKSEETADGRIIHWQQPGWDLQAQLNARSGISVEVAGPTTGGYYWLNDMTLSDTLIITNGKPRRTMFVADNERDKIVDPDPVDVRAMPWVDQQVGVLLCSYLNVTDSAVYFDQLISGQSLTEEMKTAWTNKTELARLSHDEVALGVTELDDADPAALRLSFIREAKRVLEPGGVVIVNGVRSQEVVIMQQHGFTLRMLTCDHTYDEFGKLPTWSANYSVVLSRDD